MLILFQVCRNIDKKLYIFNSNIGSERTNESNGIYKRHLCCKEEDRVWRQSEVGVGIGQTYEKVYKPESGLWPIIGRFSWSDLTYLKA